MHSQPPKFSCLRDAQPVCSSRPTTYVSATQLTASLTPADVAATGPVAITAVNPAPGGGTSSAAAFSVLNPVPTLTALSPASVTAGSTSATIQTTGSNFVSGATVQVNGTARATVVASSTQLSFSLTSSDLATAGSLNITVNNPAPGGGASAAASIAVNTLPPSITSFNPASLVAGTATGTTVVVNGDHFLLNSVIQVNGATRATTFISSTALSFSATVADQSTAGNLSIVVVTPGAVNSPALALPVITRPKTPILTLMTPSAFYSGDPDTTGYLYGSNFTSATTVQSGSTSLSVTGFTSTRLAVTVPASLLANASTFPITATTPGALSASNALTGTVTDPPASVLNVSNFQSGGPFQTDTTVTVSGSNFSARTVVTVNGIKVPVISNLGYSLSFTIPASTIALPGNYTVSITVPPPGGGTTSFNFTAYIPLVNNDTVYNPANGLIYASIPGGVGSPLGNSIVSVDPLTGSIGKPIFVGSEPNRLALTSDGRYLWVELDGSSSIRRIDLITGVADAPFSAVLSGGDIGSGNDSLHL